MLADGRAEKGFKKLDQLGAIHEMADGKERIDAIAEDYYYSAYGIQNRPTKEVLVVAPTHAEGEIVTARIRQELKEKQVIGQNERPFTVLRNRQLTEAEKQQPENYRLGDVLAFYQNSKGVKAGRKLEVTNMGENELFAKDATGLPYTVAFSESHKFSVFEPRPIHVSGGDKIRITANGKSNEGKHLFNGSTFRVEAFDKEGALKLSNGSTIPADFGHFNLGYVSTSHASQGKTADKVIISQSSATFRASSMEQFYVSVSRGKEAVSIYTDDKAHLQQAVSQSAERTTATELMAKRQEQAQELNRRSHFRSWQEKPKENYTHLKTRHDGLQTAARTE